MFRLNRKGQSLLEYAILLSVVVAALIIMQFIIKRGYEGNLKDSSDKMGDRYSLASGDSLSQRTMGTDQKILDLQGTGNKIDAYTTVPTQNIIGDGVLELVDRSVQQQGISNTVKMDGVKNEKTRWQDVPDTQETAQTMP